MCILTLSKVNVFSRVKEWFESILIFALLREIIYVIPFFYSYKISNPVVNEIILLILNI